MTIYDVVVSKGSLGNLISKVNNRLKEGWKLQGGFSPQCSSMVPDMYYQAMTLEKPDEEKPK